MKKTVFFWAVAALTLLVGCQPGQRHGACHVVGTVEDSTMNGQRIIIEPLDLTKTSVKSDTVVINNGRFEASLDSVLVYKVMPADGMLYAVLQPLIIVGEPGEVWVSLSSNSHSGGTLQNDTLQQWKTLTEAHSHEYTQLVALSSQAGAKGDTVQAATLRQKADSLHLVYAARTRRMAESIGEGPLSDFLSRFYQ